MITGKTSSGFAFELDEHTMDSMELLDAIVEVDDNLGNISKVLKMLMPEEKRKKLYDHLRTEHGNVPIMAVANEVAEIFKYNQKGKN